MKNFLFLYLLLIAFFSDAQSDSTLLSISKKLYAAKTDVEKQKYNEELLSNFEKRLTQPHSFDDSFDSLKKDIGILISPDNRFKIINWNVPKTDGTQMYYGFIQYKHIQKIKKNIFKKQLIETIQLYPLIDKSNEIKNAENHIGDNKKWFGMLYYKIIVKKTKTKTYYTLLAWDGNDKFTSKKIIDVLTFDEKGSPRFGADIFNMEKKYPKRVIFEYAADCNMSLRFDAKKDSIVFDHLAPTQPQLKGQFQYYCSDMSYDGFGFKKGTWNYGTDINATNPESEKDKYYNNPKNKNATKKDSNQIISPRTNRKNK